MTGFFNTVVCSDDVRKTKPDPEPYVLAMRNLAVTQGIAFEDSSAGKASARAAGLKVVEVSSPSALASIIHFLILDGSAPAKQVPIDRG